jgi:drug/metabolite transporter (DMT)-like permease
MRKGRHTAKVYFFLTLAPCLWGGNFIAGQYIGDDLNGATANLLRWLVAILAMVPFLAQAVLRDWYAVVRAVPYLFGLGLLGVAGFNTVLYEGLKLVSVSIAAVAFACTPVLIALFSSVIDRRLPARSLVIGVFLSFGGVTYANAGALQGGADPLGVALVGLASLLWAIYCVALRWKPQDVSTEAGFLVQTALGSCMLVPISWATGGFDGIFSLEKSGWASVLYLGIFAAAGAFWLWQTGLAVVGPAHAGVFLNLVPVAAVLLAWVVFAVPPSQKEIVAMLVVLAGVGISMLPDKLPAGATRLGWSIAVSLPFFALATEAAS